MSPLSGGLCCKTPKTPCGKISAKRQNRWWGRQSNIDVGDNELTDDLGGAFEATSIDGCRPGKFVIGVTKRLLQHNLPDNGLRTSRGRCPLGADFVAKVENRTTLKISRKSIFGLLCCC